MLRVESLQVAVAGSMEQNEDGRHAREGEGTGLVAPCGAGRQQPTTPVWFKEPAEVVDVAEQG